MNIQQEEKKPTTYPLETGKLLRTALGMIIGIHALTSTENPFIKAVGVIIFTYCLHVSLKFRLAQLDENIPRQPEAKSRRHSVQDAKQDREPSADYQQLEEDEKQRPRNG